MALWDKVLGKRERSYEETYIDLGEWVEKEGPIEKVKHKMQVRVADIYRFEDIGHLTGHIYNGELLIIDYSSVSDEITLQRITRELAQLTKEVGGDVVDIGRKYIIATPAGVKIAREKIRPPL